MESTLLKVAEAANQQISAVHDAFGAPGDYGYESREGKALHQLYLFQVELRAALRQTLIEDVRDRGASEERLQLVARIKRSSKYWGQTPPNQWFEVRFVDDRYYQLRGNNNNYRLIDVVCGVRLPSGSIVDLGKGKIERGVQ